MIEQFKLSIVSDRIANGDTFVELAGKDDE